MYQSLSYTIKNIIKINTAGTMGLYFTPISVLPWVPLCPNFSEIYRGHFNKIVYPLTAPLSALPGGLIVIFQKNGSTAFRRCQIASTKMNSVALVEILSYVLWLRLYFIWIFLLHFIQILQNIRAIIVYWKSEIWRLHF